MAHTHTKQNMLTVHVMAIHGRPAPSLGPGRGAWVIEPPELFGLTTEALDIVLVRSVHVGRIPV